MKEYLFSVLEGSKVISIEEIVLHMLVAVVIGGAIYISYWMTHMGTVYSKKFNVSLVMLILLTTTVMAVIGNNVALSLGMVGALSIVRYRTAIKDSRDTAYIFWAIVAGICCGVGDYMVAAIGSSIVFLVLLALGRVKNDNRILIIIRGVREKERDIEAVIFETLEKKAILRVKNSTESSIEMIYEVSKKSYDKTYNHTKSLIDKIYDIGNMEYVNIVVQNEEIV